MRHLKTSLVMILSIFLVGSLFLFNGCKKKEPKAIKIGAILPLTGTGAEFGEEEKKGIMLAVENINSEGGVSGHKVEVIYEDSKTDPKEAVSIFNKMLSTSSPPAILTAMSSVGMALKPLVEQHKIVTFIIAGNPALTKEGGYIFRMLPTASNQTERLAKLVSENLKLKDIAVFYINDDLGDGLKTTFVSSFEKLGGSIKAIETFAKEGTNFRPQITKIITQKPKAIFLAGYGKTLGILIKQIREMGYKGILLGTPELPYPDVLSVAGKAAEEAIVVDVHINKDTPKVKRFIERYKERYKKDPTLDAYLAYDEIQMLAEAMKKNRFSAKPIRDEVLKIKDFPGLTGTLSVMPNGDVSFSLGLKIIKNGETVPYEP